VRDAYTKLSAGHVSIDLSDTSDPLRVPEPGVVEPHTRGKIARVAYWYRRLRDGRRQVVEGFAPDPGVEINPDAEHPRILAAVKEIETWTAQREKVLVFGVFLQPLHLLRDVVNIRYALRAADTGRPIANAVHKDPALLGIAVRQVDRLRDEGMLTGRLAGANSTEMRRALQDSHKAYERLRRQVREGAKKPLKAWRADRALLGGAPVDRELDAALQDHLVSFVIDDFLAATSESDQPARERLDEAAQDFLEDYLRPLLGELGGEDPGEKGQGELRREALRGALIEDHDGRQRSQPAGGNSKGVCGRGHGTVATRNHASPATRLTRKGTTSSLPDTHPEGRTLRRLYRLICNQFRRILEESNVGPHGLESRALPADCRRRRGLNC
jgi:hypothetical protein